LALEPPPSQTTFCPRRGGRGDSHIKKGVLIGNFEKNPKKVPRSRFVSIA